MRFHKNLYEQIRYESAHPTAVADRPQNPSLLLPALWCVIPALLLLAFRLLRGSRPIMDAVVFGFTTPLKHQLARLNDHIPFPVGELIWVLGLLALAVFLVRTVFLLIREPDRLQTLLRRFLALLGAGLVIYCCYTLMWGCNYYATPFAVRAGLSSRGSTADELAQLTYAFAQRCNELAGQMPRDSSGVTDLDEKALFPGSQALYEAVCQELPALDVERHDPKPMILSRLLSLTGFSGFYFPMTAESIVNVDQADCMIPSTILHELAHQCNVAEEDAANFAAILAGLRCDDPRFQYSSALLGYIHLSNALYQADQSYYSQIQSTLSEPVLADLKANDAYWDQFESPVSEASEQVYSGFLESYGHSEGMKSYGMCVDLLSGYYFGEDSPYAKRNAAAETEKTDSDASGKQGANTGTSVQQSDKASDAAAQTGASGGSSDKETSSQTSKQSSKSKEKSKSRKKKKSKKNK